MHDVEQIDKVEIFQKGFLRSRRNQWLELMHNDCYLVPAGPSDQALAMHLWSKKPSLIR